MNNSEWVLDRLYNELRYMSDRGSREVNTDMLMAYIDLLKEQSVFLEEKLHQESAIEDAAMIQLGKGMKKANFPAGTYHIVNDPALDRVEALHDQQAKEYQERVKTIREENLRNAKTD